VLSQFCAEEDASPAEGIWANDVEDAARKISAADTAKRVRIVFIFSYIL
jgi:hypothetical protein